MKKITRLICTIVAIAMLFSMAAFAAEYESDVVPYPAGNHTYDLWSSVYTGSGSKCTVAAWVAESNRVKVPVGYMGARARVYNEDRELVEYSDWRSNTVVDNFIVVAFEYRPTGTFYGRGEARLYTGTKTEVVDCPETVMISGRSYATNESITAFEGVTEYAVNAAGETYGSAMMADVIGYEPDLISAVGDNGVSGYVRRDDFNPEINNPKEAYEYTINHTEPSVIAVYDLEGNVIDSLTASTVAELPDELVQAIKEREEMNRQMVKSAINSRSSEYIKASGVAVGVGDVGDKGERISGYVSQRDINGPEVNTLEDVEAYMTGFAGIRFPVHLYDASGSIIGEFWGGGGFSMFDSMSREEIVAMSNGHIK